MPLLCRLTGVFVVCCCLVTVKAAEIHVPGDYPYIQRAINNAINGDTILVAPGTYFENINFMGKEIVLKGIRGPEYTTLDGMQAGSVVTFDSGENIRSVLRGFTICNGRGTVVSSTHPDYYYGGGIFCNGSAPLIINNIITGNMLAFRGGGICCIDSNGSTIISDCTITDNKTNHSGGGIYCDKANITVLNNSICNNISEAAGGGGIAILSGFKIIIKNSLFNNNCADNGGGAIYSTSGNYPIIDNNLIQNNHARDGGGILLGGGTVVNNLIAFNAASKGTSTIVGYGGGISCSSNANIINNIIRNNVSRSYGGGIYCFGYNIVVDSNIISYNEVSGGTAPSETRSGGGIMLYTGSSYVTNCIVFKNYAEESGGGIYIRGAASSKATSNIINNTIADNSSDYGSGIYAYAYCNFTATNDIFRNDGVDEISYMWRKPSITYSNIKGGYPGRGNIDSDPIFVDSTNSDYHLQYLSPCREAGDNMVAELPDTDFEGDPRIAYGTVDMGADEFHPHLYYTGQAVPSSEISIKTIGLPRTMPLGIFLGKNSLETPLPSTYGDWYLGFPVSLIKYGFNIPMTGVYSFDARIPDAPLDTYYLQALIGDELSNLCTVELE